MVSCSRESRSIACHGKCSNVCGCLASRLCRKSSSSKLLVAKRDSTEPSNHLSMHRESSAQLSPGHGRKSERLYGCVHAPLIQSALHPVQCTGQCPEPSKVTAPVLVVADATSSYPPQVLSSSIVVIVPEGARFGGIAQADFIPIKVHIRIRLLSLRQPDRQSVRGAVDPIIL